MKKLIAIAVAVIVVGIGARPAEACFFTRYCTPTQPCSASGSYYYRHVSCDPGDCQALPSLLVDGQACNWVGGTQGAVGCVNRARCAPWPFGEDPPPGANVCRSWMTATLSGIGCCAMPCPPISEGCHEN
jgi:hypothetical protein